MLILICTVKGAAIKNKIKNVMFNFIFAYWYGWIGSSKIRRWLIKCHYA